MQVAPIPMAHLIKRILQGIGKLVLFVEKPKRKNIKTLILLDQKIMK